MEEVAVEGRGPDWKSAILYAQCKLSQVRCGKGKLIRIDLTRYRGRNRI